MLTPEKLERMAKRLQASSQPKPHDEVEARIEAIAVMARARECGEYWAAEIATLGELGGLADGGLSEWFHRMFWQSFCEGAKMAWDELCKSREPHR